MAVVGDTGAGVTLRVVFCGPPAAGKTTNLQAISRLIYGNELGRLTPRTVGEDRLVSVEIPLGALGVLAGARVLVRLETLQGDVSSPGAWARTLMDADGIVFVADSSPHARGANVKALVATRYRLERSDRPAAPIPVVMQWNKRDLADARPVGEMETDLNQRCFPSIEASSLRATGVVKTLVEILKRTIDVAHGRALGAALADADLGRDLAATIERLARSARVTSAEHYGETLELKPSTVFSSDAIDASPARMLSALFRATTSLEELSLTGPPDGLMAGLLSGCERTHGSLLLFRQRTVDMEEREVVPAGGDPLNALLEPAGTTKAATLCAGHAPSFIGELATERLRSALIVPLAFGKQAFGGLIVYVADDEQRPTAAEQAYWKTAATVTSVYLAWQAAKGKAVASRRAGSVTKPDRSERLDV